MDKDSCKECAALLQAYLDNELDTTAAIRVAAHLGSCSGCRAKADGNRALIEAVRGCADYHRAPLGIAEIIDRRVKTETPVQLRRSLPPWAPLLAVVCAVMLYVSLPGHPAGIDDEVVSEHVRSLMEHHLVDVESTDQHTVKPWFEGRLDFSPPVTDFAAQGYPLVGGRLDYINHRATAAIIYRRNKHIINVFIMREPGVDVPAMRNGRSGFNIVSWRNGGFSFYAVSDLNSAELTGLAVLIAK
jgi:anti-sigma factor RsiW